MPSFYKQLSWLINYSEIKQLSCLRQKNFDLKLTIISMLEMLSFPIVQWQLPRKNVCTIEIKMCVLSCLQYICADFASLLLVNKCLKWALTEAVSMVFRRSYKL